MMEQEYTMSSGSKIFYSVLAAGLFVFSLLLLSIYNSSIGPFVLLISALLLIGSLLITLNIYRRKVIIYNDSIVCTRLFTTRELSITDAKGCRIGNKVIYIEPVTETDDRITISNYDDLRDSDELVKWIKNNFTDLDSIDLKNNQNQVYQNPQLGYTEADRNEKIKRIKELAWAYNIWGGVMSFIMIFFNNMFSLLVLLITPLIGIIVMATSHGLTKFVSNSKRSVYNFILIGFWLPSFMLLIKSLNEYSLLNMDNLWLPAIITSGFLFMLMFFYGINRSVASVTGQAVFMFVLCLLYGFGSILQVNGFFDSSKPQIFNAVVLDSRVSHGKSNTYLLTLNAWGPRHEIKEVEVHKSLYKITSIGDTVKVSLRPGLLHIPWFEVSKD